MYVYQMSVLSPEVLVFTFIAWQRFGIVIRQQIFANYGRTSHNQFDTFSLLWKEMAKGEIIVKKRVCILHLQAKSIQAIL